MRKAIATLALLTPFALGAIDLRSERFSTFVNKLGVPQEVAEDETFGSDSWWGGGKEFSDWELSDESQVWAMGEYMWTFQYPVWNGTEWGGNLFYTGSSDYGSFIAVRSGEIERNTDKDSTSVRAGGTVNLIDKASGDPIGTEPFSLIFTRTMTETNYPPAARFTPTAESALYHVLDAVLERRYFAGEYMNDTWDITRFGPNQPTNAWFHLPEPPGSDDPHLGCYYSPQPGVAVESPTNRVIFTRRFAEYGNIVSNFQAVVRWCGRGFQPHQVRIRYPINGWTPNDTAWSSSYLWQTWEDATPQPVTTWSDALGWDVIGKHTMPTYRGLYSEAPFTFGAEDGYQIRFIYPASHCFGNGDRIAQRRVKLGYVENPQGALKIGSNLSPVPLTCEMFTASNYSHIAWSMMNDDISRRFEPTFLASFSQWLGLMDKTVATMEDGMDATTGVRSNFYARATVSAPIAIPSSAITYSFGEYRFDSSLPLGAIRTGDWEVSWTNFVLGVSVTNGYFSRSAWIHMSEADDSYGGGFDLPMIAEDIIDDQFLNSIVRWDMIEDVSNHTIEFMTSTYSDSLGITLRSLVGAQVYGSYEIQFPSNFVTSASARISRAMIGDFSVHSPPPYEYQPGPRSRQWGVVENAALWGFHSVAYDDVFGFVSGVPLVLSKFLEADYSSPSAVGGILRGWYDAQLIPQLRVFVGGSPWDRMAFGTADAKAVAAGMFIDPDMEHAMTVSGPGVNLVIDVTDGHVHLRGYEAGGVFHEATSVAVAWRFVLSTGRAPVNVGSNKLDRVEAISADAKSTVTQVIDWQFNSLKPVSTGND